MAHKGFGFNIHFNHAKVVDIKLTTTQFCVIALNRRHANFSNTNIDIYIYHNYTFIMIEIHFSWDETKAKANLLKHKISFNEAVSVFSDDNARLIYDPDHSLEEERFLLLGISYKLNLLIVIHCMKHENNEIRIISARKASKKEQKQYGGYLL